MNNPAKALQEIMDECLGMTPEEVYEKAKKALEPEFKPEVGKLYSFFDEEDDQSENAIGKLTHSDPGDKLWLQGCSDFFMKCRELTEQEWKGLGCPVIEVNNTVTTKPRKWEDYLSKATPVLCWVGDSNKLEKSRARLVCKFSDGHLSDFPYTDDNNINWTYATPVNPSECYKEEVNNDG